MVDKSKGFHVREMCENDLPDIVAIHKICFPPGVSLFSAMDDKILMSYYRMFISEPGSSAAVIVMNETNQAVGFTFGTRFPGIRKRFAKTHPLELGLAILKAVFISHEMRAAIRHRPNSKNKLLLYEYDKFIQGKGVPEPAGLEDIWMGLAIHPDFRGGGKAVALVDYYCESVFKDKNVVRIRGAILKNNIASMKLFERLGWNFCDITDNQVSIWLERRN